MHKAILTIVLAALCLCFRANAQTPVTPPHTRTSSKGKVISASTGEPLPGAVINIAPTGQTLITDDNGAFTLNLPGGTYQLTVRYLSYKAQSLTVAIPLKELLIITLRPNDQNLQEVEIVSTGYQNIPKERATGSFTVIDNKTLNRTVSPDLLTRLKGVTNGLLFDNNTGNSTGISVRGRSTIFSNTTPLIIVDNFPFEGDLNTLNPDMIENVTVLKDAAAASIWGVRAGNGVIVITTKKGRLNQKPNISGKADLTLGGKPDLYYQPQLTSSEYIDIEQFLFDKGAYNATINNGYATISPVVAILQKIKLDPAYAAQGMAEIDALRNIDSRDQLGKYFYRNSSRQHYTADVTGGGTNQTYYFSAGYDKNLPTSVALSDSRITLKGNNTYNLLNNRLKLSTDVTFSKSHSDNANAGSHLTYMPYDQIADENGNPLPTLISGGLRAAYTDTAGDGRLLDWKYRPLDELRRKYNTSLRDLTDYRLNLGLTYKIISPLSVSINYQYYSANTKQESTDNKDSFYTRNLINTYSEIDAATDIVTSPIPYGDIYSPSFISRQANYGRGQVNFNQVFDTKHAVSAIAGFEIRDDRYKYNSYTLYGYTPETATSIQIDPVSDFPVYYRNRLSTVGQAPNQGGTTNRYVSVYGNASYAYDGRYIISGSYRKDESNLFGVKANQKGVPLWSAGMAWNVHRENFFQLDWISTLQLKATYGYNGNVNNSISAYLTAEPSLTNTYTNTQYYAIVNPPNEDLRWERVKNINIGLDFSTKQNRLSGSIEYYIKNGLDLISTSPIAPQTGISLFTGNTANIATRGLDILLNSNNINRGFKWNTILIFNYVKDEVTDYKVAAGANIGIVNASQTSLAPLVGYPVNSVFAYKWGGLDAAGNPQGYLDGEISMDYTKIRNSNDASQLEFFGSATPTIFGSIRNTFSYKRIEISFNIIYKLGYYFRRKSLNYTQLFSGSGYTQADYPLRWQKPGDEYTTDVPSLVYPNVSNRTDFYVNSGALIEPGDHFRLQDIQLNYSFTKKQFKKLPFSDLNIYMYVSNPGIVWTANKYRLDPDVRGGYPNPATVAFGLKTNF